MKSKEQVIQLSELFGILATGNTAQIKEVKKNLAKIDRYSGNFSAPAKVYIFDQIKNIDDIKDPLHISAVIAGLGIFYLSLLDDYFLEICSFTLKYLQHPDGRVREQTRKAASWLRIMNRRREKISDLKPEIKELVKRETKAFDDLLKSLKELIYKYTPENRPTYIGDTGPSVYKTLVLFWYDMNPVAFEYDVNKESQNPLSDDYIPRFGNSDYEEEVDPEEIRDNIWLDKKDGDPGQAVKWLKKLEAIAIARFEKSSAHLGLNKTEIVEMMTIIRKEGQVASTKILERHLSRLSENGDIAWAKVNNFVRDIEAFGNHCIAENEHGFISFLLVEAVTERECSFSGKPENLVDFMELICLSHEMVDKFFDQHEKKCGVDRNELLELIDKTRDGLKKEDKHIEELVASLDADEIDRLYGRSIAHHMLDWFIQSDPKAFNRMQDPRKIVAYIAYAVREINSDILRLVRLHYANSDLTTFGGWAGSGSFNMVRYAILRPILEMVGDPSLLLIDPVRVKKAEWFRRDLY
ncbi:MAG: hypothetical protein Q7S57_05195 [bacterium]|nr:hypothetical protein [bacterium]